VIELVTDDHVVHTIVVEVLGQVRERRLWRHHADVRTLAELGHQHVQLPDIAFRRRIEDVAMWNHLTGDRIHAANRVDLGASTFERGDDPTELIEVV